jgi:hypothetical protein
MKVSLHSDLRISERNENSMANPMFSIKINAKRLLQITRHVAQYPLYNTAETEHEVQVFPVQVDFSTPNLFRWHAVSFRLYLRSSGSHYFDVFALTGKEAFGVEWRFFGSLKPSTWNSAAMQSSGDTSIDQTASFETSQCKSVYRSGL